MKITHLKINHLVNPLGYDLERPTISYVVEETRAKRQVKARVMVSLSESFEDMVYDSGESEDITSTAFELPIQTEPETRYYWKVRVWADNGDAAESGAAWFETPKPDKWQADWITPDVSKEMQVSLLRRVTIRKPVKRARMYMTGLGLYELYLNGEKQGEEFLLPGFCAYDSWIPYQTFDVGLKEGDNEIEVLLGDGWYKGCFGLRKKKENYGERLACIGELHIWYADGTREVVATDTSWEAKKSKIVASGIYSGEVYDARLYDEERYPVKGISLDKDKLAPRLNPPIKVQEEITPVEVIHTPAGETVLDMGQNMVGWLAFFCRAKEGTRFCFQFGEILQDGNFYRENLRDARAEFVYVAGKTPREVRQHFTFYGFRYVKISGWENEEDLTDFRGLVLYSDMEEIGWMETSDSLVNQLIHNVKWGQKGNFLDVPTDCPQRDERYGWTGDAQVFCGTACFNMDTYAFYTKYGKDLYLEQKKLGGNVPNVVPVANYPGAGSAAWGDAAAIIPWNVYLHYGDKGILLRQYDSMKAWVDYIKAEDEKYGKKRLWQSGFHLADWLALDGKVKDGRFGATDPFLISSAYYYYSASIVAKAANVIGKAEDAAYYGRLAGEVRLAFIREYFTPAGHLCVDTMTAYVLVLYMGLTPEFAYERTCAGLLEQLKKNQYHLNTGFVGTTYLCRALSENNMNGLAYHLLLEKGFPGWLYAVLLGATTIWERWNSVLTDGKMNETGMNSLNHYANGSVMEWMYRNVAGIQPSEEGAGFKRFTVAPMPDYQISWVKASLRSASGRIKSEWSIEEGRLKFAFEIPFDTRAVLVLPDADLETIQESVNGREGVVQIRQAGKNVEMEVEAGSYAFEYEPSAPYRKVYSIDSPLEELMENESTLKVLEEHYFQYYKGLSFDKLPFRQELYALDEFMNVPFTHLPYEQQEELDAKLREVTA